MTRHANKRRNTAMNVIKDLNSTDATIDLDAEQARADELLAAFTEVVSERLPLDGAVLCHATLCLLCKTIEMAFYEPNKVAKEIGRILVQQVPFHTNYETQLKTNSSLPPS